MRRPIRNQEAEWSGSRAWLCAPDDLTAVYRLARDRGAPGYLGVTGFMGSVAHRSYWGKHSGSCIFHGQTHRYSFFRGGGLGGRPRTPYDTPLGGRPSGARPGRAEREWERQAQKWEEVRRFEELDSDDNDGQGVVLDGRFVSDALRFTGADLGPHIRRRRSYYDPNDGSGSSDEDAEQQDESNSRALQLALRDKEEMLVQKALERIRRAQMIGKANVKLTQLELDALERKRRSDQAQGKTRGPLLKSSDGRRSGGRPASAEKPAQLESSRRKSSSSRISLVQAEEESASAAAVTPPGIVIRGADGTPMYAPLGYYPPPPAALAYGTTSRPGSRSASAHSQQQQLTPPLQPPLQRASKKRYFSVPERAMPSPASRMSTSHAPLSRRILPDDPESIARPRSASTNQPHTVDPFQYQTYSPPLPQLPPQYGHGRRIVSGPAGVQYPAIRRAAAATRPYAASSDPSLSLRRTQRSQAAHELDSESGDEEDDDSEDDEDEDEDDDDHGVHVDVVPHGQGYDVNFTPEGVGGGKRRSGRR